MATTSNNKGKSTATKQKTTKSVAKNTKVAKPTTAVSKAETSESIVSAQELLALKDIIQKQQETIQNMEKLITKYQDQNNDTYQASPVTPVTVEVPSTDVTVVYCSESIGYAKISNMELNFNRYGEEFVLSRNQFDELVGKYRGWFDRGVLAVSYKNTDVAIAKGVMTDKEIGLSPEQLNSIGRMSTWELEDLWNKTTLDNLRESIVYFYKRKIIEQDPMFTNREKIDLMNRLTAGGFNREQDELNGRFKITPTEM